MQWAVREELPNGQAVAAPLWDVSNGRARQRLGMLFSLAMHALHQGARAFVVLPSPRLRSAWLSRRAARERVEGDGAKRGSFPAGWGVRPKRAPKNRQPQLAFSDLTTLSTLRRRRVNRVNPVFEICDWRYFGARLRRADRPPQKDPPRRACPVHVGTLRRTRQFDVMPRPS